MITAITIEGFKSLEQVNLNLGNLNLFIGTNASGKSNFFDALRVLQGIGYGFTIDEIFNGKPKSASSEVWEQIRGGSSKADFVRRGDLNPNLEERVIRLSVHLQLRDESTTQIQYSISISAQFSCVRSEKLQVGDRLIFDSEPITNLPTSPVLEIRYYTGKPGQQPHLKFENSRPILHQLLRDRHCDPEHAEYIENCIHALSNSQHLDPSPSILRNYSQANIVKRMGEKGENFAGLVKNIIADEKEKDAFVSWLKELTPNELDDIRILHGAVGEALFALKDGEQIHPATILSDGTLRFSAITAAFFQPDLPDIITNEDDYQTTFICDRDKETGATNLVPLIKLPHLLKSIQKQSITELFAEGWFERLSSRIYKTAFKIY